jgi:Tfp pilus assembly protein PilX
MIDLLTNGYPDPTKYLAGLKKALAETEQQLCWCDKPWDDSEGWSRRVKALQAEIATMEPSMEKKRGHSKRAA